MLSCKNIFLCILMLFFAMGIKAQSSLPSAKPGFKLFFEKTYLHTDRDVYAIGDTLWFKAYLMDAQNNTPAKSSGTLYVNLIAPNAQVISTEIIRLNDGLGHGDFTLTDTLAPGLYHLRAYTTWMRNFGDNFIFEKNITLAGSPVNAIKTPGNPKVKSTKKPAATITPATTSISKPYTVNFYPEGGSMVEGVSSLIAVKAESNAGKGVAATGTVLSASGDTIARFNCDTLGMGLFTLLPFKGQDYHASVKIANKLFAFSMPGALKSGLSLQLKQTDTVLHAVISSNILTSSTANPQYIIAVKHGGQTLISQQIPAGQQQMAVKIPTAQLPEGIAAITLYDEQNRPNCERLVYIHHPGQQIVAASTNKKAYQPFEKTSVQINTGKAAYLSMAVVDAGVVPQQADDIRAYLMLGSELKGNVEQSRRYFDTTNVNRFKQLDLLLLTQGWRDFIWRKLADTAIRVSYPPEDGITVAGLVEDEVNHKPMPGLNVSLFASGAKDTKLFSARDDSHGRFAFTNLALYGTQTIKLASLNNKGDSKGSILVDSLFTLPVKPITKPGLTDTNTVSQIAQAMVQKATAANTAKGITQLKEVKIKANKNFVTLDNGRKLITWGEPQVFNITPNDYQFKTLTWFLQQNDKRAVLNDANKPGVAYIIDGRKAQPRLMVNGSTFHIDKERFFNMPIEKFKHIEVIGLPAGVLISVITKQADPLIDNPGSLSLDVQGYYQARTFYKPQYDTAKPGKTDIRTTIHWEPNIKTDINGQAAVSFYNTSGSASISVIVQGITADGTPVSTEAHYAVK
ncbi:MAG: MG2 domain-containing protein [Bacteroidota bacterium]